MFPPEVVVVNGRKQYLHNLSKIKEDISTETLSYLMLMDSAQEAMETIATILAGDYNKSLDWLYSTLNSNT